MTKPTNHCEKILQFLQILKMKMTGEQLDLYLQQHGQGALSVSELLAKFLESPAHASQEAVVQSRIKRAGFPTDATLESYDWTRNPKTIRPEPFLELATGQFIGRKEKRGFRCRQRLGKNSFNAGSCRKCCALGYRVSDMRLQCQLD